MAARLILVRRSKPLIEPDGRPADWRLSEEGREAARALAARLTGFDVSTIWTSPERKARETADLLAEMLGRPVQEAADLREHGRGLFIFAGQEQLEDGVRRLLASHDDLVFGDETARDVLGRMERALAEAAQDAAGRDSLVVTHGTTTTIVLARRCGIDAFAFWRSLTTPAAVVVEGSEIVELVQ